MQTDSENKMKSKQICDDAANNDIYDKVYENICKEHEFIAK